MLQVERQAQDYEARLRILEKESALIEQIEKTLAAIESKLDKADRDQIRNLYGFILTGIMIVASTAIHYFVH